MVANQICSIAWDKVIGYFATVIVVMVVPCLLYTMVNFITIAFWQIWWKLGLTREKLTGYGIRSLFEPTHAVCFVLFLLFLLSWIPFVINTFRYIGEFEAPNVFYFWLGSSQGIWKLPIMIIVSPRYREYVGLACKRSKKSKALPVQPISSLVARTWLTEPLNFNMYEGMSCISITLVQKE